MIYDRSKWFRMELSRKEVGRRIARARRARTPDGGWTQKDLAQAMGVSWHTVVGWENGVRFPQTRYLGTLANCLRRSLDWILLGRGRNARHWKLKGSS
jgi:transcriptional regulator with XRE-family HTH domain